MLPIRFAMSRRFCEASLTGLTLLLLLGAVFLGPLQAGPLPPQGVDDFRLLIDHNRDPHPEPAAAGSTLADYRRKLRQATKDLPSLGEVSRVLLLSEWSFSEFDFGEKLPLDRIHKAVLELGDDAFKSEVQKMMAAYSEETVNLNDAIVAEIKREVRLQLLERLETRTRFYLSQGRLADRIAAANLISDTINTSRRQDVSQFRDPESGRRVESVKEVMVSKPQDITRSSQFRERLRGLSGDLEKLLADPNSSVRIAGIRALSNLEKEPGDLVAILKPLLTSEKSDAPTRQAAAEALDRVLEVYTISMEKSRPQPYLTGVEKVLPVAASGLSDSDARVRRASLEACQRAALVLDELASDPLAALERRAVFRPTLAVVDSVLPKLNACVRDPIPELRVGACHVLETIALAAQKLRRSSEGENLPAPSTEPSNPYPYPAPKKEGGKYKKRVSRPFPESPRGDLVRTAAFQARQPDELPPPLPADGGIEGTVQTMIDNLKHADYRVRLAAVDTLETFGAQAEAAIPPLVAILCDYNKFVRWSSARTLGRLHPRQADKVVPGLMHLLDDREDPSVRIAAAKALELYGEHAKKAVPLLARVINRGDKEYIIAILHTIQGIGTDAAPALPNVAWVLSDRTQPPSVRIEAAQTLGRFGALAVEQLPVLREVMNNDTDEDVRNAASTAVLAVDRPIK
ncbi:MAG TPA: HEAT repeat domain-containing protein [Gemmataceae bacterium]|nr:HEAT repeat domain-containing protein [Gemmataceae bacterium]